MATEKRFDLIDRKALGIGYCNPLVFDKIEYAHGWNCAIEILMKAPTVDAVEVVHGCNVYDHDSSFECSVCGWGDYDTLTADTAKYNYCPNCGAKMNGERRIDG